MMLKLKTSPRPLTGTHREAVELQFEHRSWAGNRSFPQLSHFWTIRRPARAPSKKSRMSGVIAGMGLLISGIELSLYPSVEMIGPHRAMPKLATARLVTNAMVVVPVPELNA